MQNKGYGQSQYDIVFNKNHNFQKEEELTDISQAKLLDDMQQSH